LAVVVAGGAAIGFVRWRAGEQELALVTHTNRCQEGVRESCDWLRTACAKRAGRACRSLAETYLSGQGVEQSYGEALALGEDACRLGDLAGCMMVGGLLTEGTHVEPNAQKARAVFERACQLGNQLACNAAARQ
jgi:TPR repeat protein